MKRLSSWLVFTAALLLGVLISAPSAQVAANSGSTAAPKKNGDILYGGFPAKNGSRLLYLMRPDGRTSGGLERRATSGVRPGLLAATGLPTAPRLGTESSVPSSTSCEATAPTPDS